MAGAQRIIGTGSAIGHHGTVGGIRMSDRSSYVVLLCGASHMGKSYAAKNILAKEYGAVYGRLDKIYTVAVREAGMVKPSHAKQERSQREKEARRQARDRQWSEQSMSTRFFDSLKHQIRSLMQQALDCRALTVLEGGTLRREDELAVVKDCVRDVLGEGTRIIRVTIEAPYSRWLSNRVNRAKNSGVEAIKLRALSQEAYEQELKAARPIGSILVEERVLSSPEQMHELIWSL